MIWFKALLVLIICVATGIISVTLIAMTTTAGVPWLGWSASVLLFANCYMVSDHIEHG